MAAGSSDPTSPARTSRQPRSDIDPRARYPEVVTWVAEDSRQVDQLGAEVAAWIVECRRYLASGPTWRAIAEQVRPAVASLPSAVAAWYASQLVTTLSGAGWLDIPDSPTGAGALKLGPRALEEAAPALPVDAQATEERNHQEDRTDDDRVGEGAWWVTDPLF